jgi:DNA-binding transcriptional ArsR family regulator
MSANDPTDPADDDGEDVEPADVREELDRQRTRAVGRSEEGDDIIDLFSRALDTDTRTRIYVQLRQRPSSTPEEIAEGTGIYPGAVRRVLSDLRDEGVVERREGTDGDTEYTAIPPNELIDVVFGQVQDELDRMFGIDRRRGREREQRGRTEPVTIPVEKAEDETDTDDQ